MIPRKEKVFYGIGDLAYNILIAGISFYLLYFIINIGGLKSSLAAIVFIVAKVWDAITDYLMGRISDKTKSKFGKRRIYMLFGSIPFAITFICLWLVPPVDSQLLKFLFYTLIYMLFNTAITVVYIPYNSLSASMTDNYNERTSLNSYRIILANVGILLGAALFSVLAEGSESIFYALFNGNEKYSYLLAAGILGVIACIGMLVCTINVKERIDSSDNTYGFFATLKQFFKLKEFRNTALYYLLSMTAFDIIMGTFIFLVSDTLKFGGGIMSMVFIAIPLVVAMLSAPLWVKISDRKDKCFAYICACIIIAISLFLILFIPEQGKLFLAIICVLVGFCMGSTQVMPWASLPDVVDIDEYQNGSRREGAYYGVISFLYKSASGIALAIVSAVLAVFGYIEGADTQPQIALDAIRYMFAFLPGAVFLISAIFANRARINKAEFDIIVNELANRRKK